jgi:hypothetical protein
LICNFHDLIYVFIYALLSIGNKWTFPKPICCQSHDLPVIVDCATVWANIIIRIVKKYTISNSRIKILHQIFRIILAN